HEEPPQYHRPAVVSAFSRAGRPPSFARDPLGRVARSGFDRGPSARAAAAAPPTWLRLPASVSGSAGAVARPTGVCSWPSCPFGLVPFNLRGVCTRRARERLVVPSVRKTVSLSFGVRVQGRDINRYG